MPNNDRKRKHYNRLSNERNEQKKRTIVTFIVLLAGAIFLLLSVLTHFFDAPDFLWTIFLTLSITFITSAIMFFIQISLNVDIPTEVERALGPYSKMKDRGIDNVCGSKDEKAETTNQLCNTKRIRCMSRTGRDFIESYGDDIFKLLSEKPYLQVEILVCSKEAAGNTIFSRVCPGSYSYTDIVSFYEQYLRMYGKHKIDMKPRIGVREYSYALTGNVLITDNFFKFIPYLPERHSKNSIAILGHQGRMNGGLYETFDAIFDEIWGSDEVKVIGNDEMVKRIEERKKLDI